MKKLIGALIARNSGRREKLQRDLRELNRKRREITGHLDNLIDSWKRAGSARARPLQERFAKRQNEYDEIIRLVAFKECEINLPVAEVPQARIEAFTSALQASLKDTDNPKFRRAYMRLLLHKVIVGKEQIRISGLKSVLAHQLQTEKPVPPSMVPVLYRSGAVPSLGPDLLWVSFPDIRKITGKNHKNGLLKGQST